jgi:thioredoxin 1
MDIVHLSENNFRQEVLQAKELALVDFWASWCNPCHLLSQILDRLAQSHNNKIKICKVNVERQQALATQYQVLSVPTLLFFKEGRIEKQMVGMRTEAEIKKAVDALC